MHRTVRCWWWLAVGKRNCFNCNKTCKVPRFRCFQNWWNIKIRFLKLVVYLIVKNMRKGSTPYLMDTVLKVEIHLIHWSISIWCCY